MNLNPLTHSIFFVIWGLSISIPVLHATEVQNVLYSWEDSWSAPAYKSLSTPIPAQFSKSFSYSFQVQTGSDFVIGVSNKSYWRDLGPLWYDQATRQFVAGSEAVIPATLFGSSSQKDRLTSIFEIHIGTGGCIVRIEPYGTTTQTKRILIPNCVLPQPRVLTTYVLSLSLTSQSCSLSLDYLDTTTTPGTRRTLFTIAENEIPPAIWDILKSSTFAGFSDIGFRMASSAAGYTFTVQNTKLAQLNGIDLSVIDNVTSMSYPWDDSNSNNITVPVPTECAKAFTLKFSANPNSNGAMILGLYSKNYCYVGPSSMQGYGYVVRAKDVLFNSTYPNNFVYPLSAIVEYVVGSTASSIIIENKNKRAQNSEGLKRDITTASSFLPYPATVTQFIYTVVVSSTTITIKLEYIDQQTAKTIGLINVTEKEFGVAAHVAQYLRSSNFTGFTDVGFLAASPFAVKDITIGLPQEFINANTNKKAARTVLLDAQELLLSAKQKIEEVIAEANLLDASHEAKADLTAEAMLLSTCAKTIPELGTQAPEVFITAQLRLYPEENKAYASITEAITQAQDALTAKNTAQQIIDNHPQTLTVINNTRTKIINSATAYTTASRTRAQNTVSELSEKATALKAKLTQILQDITALPESLSDKSSLKTEAENLINPPNTTPAKGIESIIQQLTKALTTISGQTTYETVAATTAALKVIATELESLPGITTEIDTLDTATRTLENKIIEAEAVYQRGLLQAAAEAAAKAEAERLAAEKAAADAKNEAEKAAAEAAAKAAAEAATKAEADKIAAEKALAEAATKAEADKIAAAKAATEAAAKIEADRLAAEKAAADATKKAEADKIAAEKAAADAAAKAATEAAAKVEADRLAAEKAAADAAATAVRPVTPPTPPTPTAPTTSPVTPPTPPTTSPVTPPTSSEQTPRAPENAAPSAPAAPTSPPLSPKSDVQPTDTTSPKTAPSQVLTKKSPALSKIDEALINAQEALARANSVIELGKKLPNSVTAVALRRTAQSIKVNLDDTLRKLTQAQKSLTANPTRTLSAARIQSNIRTVENYAKNALSLIKQRVASITATESRMNTIMGT